MLLQQPEQRAEERGLAAAVRPEHAHHFAGAEREADAAPDGAAGKAEREVADLEHHQALRERAKSQRKNGVPISAVSTPGGTSIVASVRQSVSTASMKPAPISMASGSRRPKSGPTSRRAACGISRPTQPMMPLKATTEAVISVAQATTSVRRRRVSTPSARASSSGSESRFMRQRSSLFGASPSSASGAATARSFGEIDARLPSSQKVIAGSWL